ncbi:hypothetical protein GL279_18665 [Paracoccus limosus]|uniref:Uncharacterized protein n=1 Tax=Paracoccus limosus TaxID=913252 RepID=A0A844H9G4_9RHOB|nr:hypothetical protein [Paracoccus limosus]MTH36604.1 hypothetical protein [Paracoccus limosus]
MHWTKSRHAGLVVANSTTRMPDFSDKLAKRGCNFVDEQQVGRVFMLEEKIRG